MTKFVYISFMQQERLLGCFLFRDAGEEPLCVIIVTMTPWPRGDEAVRV